MALERIPTYCALCISRCGCIAVVEDGQLVRVEPDPLHPTGKAICIKARAAPEMVRHPDRLRAPLLRTRPKRSGGDPGWRAISWDEALDLVARKLGEHGPRGTAFAVTTPSGTGIADSFGWIHRLAHAFGSPNMVFATENCNWHKDHSPALTWGAGIGMPDYAHTGCMLLWGFNPATTWLAQATQIKAAQRRGARLIVVDPRGSGLARDADLWLALRPGSDAALALGLIHLLLAAGNIDHAFLTAFSDAFDAAPDGRGTVLERLAERAAGFPPERVAALTGVPPEQLRQTAALLASARPVSFFTWTGTCQQAAATAATRAVNTLYALIGDLDAPGGNVWFAKPPVADIAGFEWVDAATRAQTLGHGPAGRPLGPPAKGWVTTADLFRAVVDADPYPVRALLAFGGNFLATKPQTRQAEAALAQLDFFVQTELFETPTARWADLLLPAASCWEREGLQAGFMVSQAAESWLQLRPAVAPAPGSAKSDSWMVFEIARRLGLAERFFDGDAAAGLTHVLAPTGITAAQLRADRRGRSLSLTTAYRKHAQGDPATGFATPSRKVELWSERLRQAGFDPLPDFVPPAADPAHPWSLTCGKIVAYCHSQQRQIATLRKHMPAPVAELAVDVAQARGIADGDGIVIRTDIGEMFATARVVARLAPGTVWAQYGWMQEQTSYNACADGAVFDPVSGSNALRGVACDVGLQAGRRQQFSTA